MPNTDPTPKQPTPSCWPEPITLAQFQEYTPEKFELVDGYLFGGKDDNEARLKLLRILLINCGLDAAAGVCRMEDWREAGEHAFPEFIDDLVAQYSLGRAESAHIERLERERWLREDLEGIETMRPELPITERVVHLTINM
jgi:hypothetical protein